MHEALQWSFIISDYHAPTANRVMEFFIDEIDIVRDLEPLHRHWFAPRIIQGWLERAVPISSDDQDYLDYCQDLYDSLLALLIALPW